MRLGKQTRTAEQLRAMIQIRVDDLPGVRRRAVANKPVPVVGVPHPTPLDRTGRTWDMDAPENCLGIVIDFRSIVDALRDAYDLA